MQLDRVRCDPGLTVRDVEEADTGHRRGTGEIDLPNLRIRERPDIPALNSASGSDLGAGPTASC
jgi:hypothetical protein